MNPYAAYLGNRDPLEVISETPGNFKKVLDTIGPSRVDHRWAPGKWNARQIISHLADAEVAFAFRLRQAAAEANHVIQPFDQDAWSSSYGKLDAQLALATFTTLRQWNLAFLGTLTPDVFARTVTHPERGAMTFQTIVETMAGHDLNHQRQFDSLAAQS